jgi:hypothetical protein
VRLSSFDPAIDLLKNTVESIQVGIEDYDVGTPARLRSCVRSIHAGILLPFKERTSASVVADWLE